ncbi:MAG: PIN domain-containing protein [Chloroflexota bacterium]|nr:PIN domain-containing protein [Chloroflexota bacterium]
MVLGPRPRLFLDTNVLFSGFYSSQGAPAILIDRISERAVSLIMSHQVLLELIRAVGEKIPDKLPRVQQLLLDSRPEMWSTPPLDQVAIWIDLLSGPDAAILAAAIAAQPDYFVTGDKRFLHPAIAERSGLCIVTPAEALDRLH